MVSTPPPDAGRIIRAWRARVGLTQEELANALDVTFSTVSRWENGHVTPSRLAWRALEQLAAERGDLLLGEGGGAASPPLDRPA
jgi:putative transcriptional regulator